MPDYPIPKDTRAALDAFRTKKGVCQNPGLWFERFTGYLPGWQLKDKLKKDALVAVRDTPVDDKLRGAFVERWRTMLQDAGADTFEAQPEWRFITGLGRKGPLEVGFTFHRLYGFPVIPGSGLKGLARAYARDVLGKPDNDPEFEHVFGREPKKGEPESAGHQGGAIFYDAVPLTMPRLELDVMNPHYPKYYQGNEPPADWQSPVPILFLTVGKQNRFLFAVGGVHKKLAQDWLRQGLQMLGAGAKTSAGYGVFK